LQTERLVLREFTLQDAPDVQRLAGAFEIARMTTLIPHPY
jgi:[ribosomal protein S5]-alanine N-acetyltransferase